MKIKAIHLETSAGDNSRSLTIQNPGLSVFYSEQTPSKTACAALVANILFGQSHQQWHASHKTAQDCGRLEIEAAGRLYGVERSPSQGIAGQLAVSPLDGQELDARDVQSTFAVLPEPISRLAALNFQEPLPIDWVLSEAVTQAFDFKRTSKIRALCNPSNRTEDATWNTPGYAELIARRDELAKALEDCLSQERKQSREIDAQWHALNAEYDKTSQQVTNLQEEIRSATSKLSELDTQLKYLRLEPTEYALAYVDDLNLQLTELNEQVARWQSLLDRHEHRMSQVATQLARLPVVDDTSDVQTLADQRGWLTLARELHRDLEGEVARLARASSTHTCVCLDAHPRIRPISDAMVHQLEAFESQLVRQEQLALAKELKTEIEFLIQSRNELREPLQHLLERQRLLTNHLNAARGIQAKGYSSHWKQHLQGASTKSASESWETLEEQICSLESQQAEIFEQIQSLQDTLQRKEPLLRDLEERREQLSQQRGEAWTQQSLEELQRELASTQQAIRKLAAHRKVNTKLTGWSLASEYLAQLTNGQWIQIQASREIVPAKIVTLHGKIVPLETISNQQADIIRLSVCLAMLETCREHGLVIPLVLHEPFLHLDMKTVAALAAVLEHLSSHGHQVLVFTGSRQAADRFQFEKVAWRLEEELCYKSIREKVGLPKPLLNSKSETPLSEPIPTWDPVSNHFIANEDSNLCDLLELPIAIQNGLAENGIHTVAQLWACEPNDLALWLSRSDVGAADILNWQSILALVCFVPDMPVKDARFLCAVGIAGPEELADADESVLIYAVDRYLKTTGKRKELAAKFGRSRIRQWIRGARAHSKRWRNSPRFRDYSEKRSSTSRTTSATGRSKRGKARPTREISGIEWHLNLHDDVERAPSIGARITDKLKALGIYTVADLLQAEPQAISRGLKSRAIKAETVRSWQRQAHLMCQIPGLRCHDSQILEGCDLYQPESIAVMNPAELLTRIMRFCDSNAGERLLRSAKKPDLEEVTQWIAWAKHRRTVGAA